LLFHHNNAIYQITTASRRAAFPFARIEVIDLPDDSLVAEREGRCLEFTFVQDKRLAPIVSAKALNEHLDKPYQRTTTQRKRTRRLETIPGALVRPAAAYLARARPEAGHF